MFQVCWWTGGDQEGLRWEGTIKRVRELHTGSILYQEEHKIAVDLGGDNEADSNLEDKDDEMMSSI